MKETQAVQLATSGPLQRLSRRVVLSLPAIALAAPPAAEFSFVHFTDLHIQPELQAAEHCARCVEAINASGAVFAVAGGDLVFDANKVGKERSTQLTALYQRTVGALKMPVHNVIGNHDLFGIGDRGASGSRLATQAHREWEKEFGPRCQHFEHGGWHFLTLDSIDVLPDGGYRGWIAEDQTAWLRQTLRQLPPRAPVILTTHIPLVTGFLQYGDLRSQYPDDALVVENAREVVDLLLQYNVKAVLQGHTHICENVSYHGCQFITTGAVCGNWWKGPRLGFLNGFSLVSVSGDEVRVRHVAY